MPNIDPSNPNHWGFRHLNFKKHVMIGAIMANRSKYGLETVVSSSTDSVMAHGEKQIEESDVVGIEDGAEEVKQMLLKTKNEETSRVVSIVGMGGLGKTTRAKKVYNKKDVQQHFDCYAWLCVSQEFKAGEIFLGIGFCVMSLSNED